MNIRYLEEAVFYQACTSPRIEHLCIESPELQRFTLNAKNIADCQEILNITTMHVPPSSKIHLDLHQQGDRRQAPM